MVFKFIFLNYCWDTVTNSEFLMLTSKLQILFSFRKRKIDSFLRGTLNLLHIYVFDPGAELLLMCIYTTVKMYEWSANTIVNIRIPVDDHFSLYVSRTNFSLHTRILWKRIQRTFKKAKLASMHKSIFHTIYFI